MGSSTRRGEDRPRTTPIQEIGSPRFGGIALSQRETFAAPVLPVPREDKWRQEQQAFQRLLPELLQTQRGQFVAIHEGQVVESGNDKMEVARRAYARFGYLPIFVSLVTDQPRVPVRLPSPRSLPVEKS